MATPPHLFLLLSLPPPKSLTSSTTQSVSLSHDKRWGVLLVGVQAAGATSSYSSDPHQDIQDRWSGTPPPHTHTKHDSWGWSCLSGRPDDVTVICCLQSEQELISSVQIPVLRTMKGSNWKETAAEHVTRSDEGRTPTSEPQSDTKRPHSGGVACVSPHKPEFI